LRKSSFDMSWSRPFRIETKFFSIPGTVVLALSFALIVFALFFRIDRVAVEIWDESLFANRALHMYYTGEYMPNFNEFEGLPDHRNTKLPFTTFFQVLSFHLFGISNWALRLPIGLIFIGTIFLLIRYTHRNGISPIVALLTGVLLTTSTGFLGKHMLRTGDQDAPFACYTLLALLYFYEYIEKKRVASIVAFTFFTIAAFLTKNLLAGLILPGMVLYVILRGQLLPLLRDVKIYLSLLAIVAAYAGTVGYLELQYPGFIDRMWNYELMGRYSETIEGHAGGVFFYFKKLFNHHFTPIAYLVIPASFWLLKFGSDQKRSLTLFLLLSFLGYMAVISFSGTKTGWYHAPVFPMVALIIALGLHDIWTNGRLYMRKFAYGIAMGISSLLIVGAYIGAVKKEAFRTPGYGLEGYNTFYTKIIDNQNLNNPIWLFDNQFGTDTYFYSHVLSERIPEHEVRFEGSTEGISVGQQVMVCKGFAEKEIRDNFEVKVIANSHNCWVLEILSKK